MLHVEKGGIVVSVTLAKAYETALRSIGDGMAIVCASEGAGHWFFGVADSSGVIVPGGSPVVIDKATGEAGYPMPSVPSAVLGEPPLPIEVEAQNAADVPLPA